jgi:hypothetical protein
MNWILRFAARTIGILIAFLVALLPERMKEQTPFSKFRSNAAHALSGILECLLAFALLVYGYDQFVGGINEGLAHAVADGKIRNVSLEQLRGMGVFAFVLYLLHPIAMISCYLFIEGCIRTFAASLAGRCHGISVLWAIDRIAGLVSGIWQKAILRRRLGPDEPDSFFKDEASGTLVLTSIENKDWRERQVAQLGDDFYILSNKSLIQKNKYCRYRYTFRPMLPGEIIRGSVVVISSRMADRAAADSQN